MMSVKLQYMLSITIVCLVMLTGCNVDYEAMAKHRGDYATANTGEIVIAAIEDADHPQYIQGITLAVEEINKSKNKLLGRPLTLSIEPGTNDFKSSKSMIRRIAKNPKISIVLGHSSDNVVLPASSLYEKSKVLFFPPLSRAEELTSHDYLFTFRMVPDNIHLSRQIFDKTQVLGYKHIAVLYTRTDAHREFALLFKDAATENGLNPVFNYSFFAETMDYRPFLSDLKKKDFDAVFLSADVKTTTRLIRQMREMGIEKPIFGSGDLDTETFKTTIGMTEQKIIIPTPYNVSAENWVKNHFVTRYRNKYHQPPNADAAQGYDSVMLFANKVAKAQTTQPDVLASTIRFSQPWMGVTGNYSFNKKGNLENKYYSFQVFNQGKFQPL